MTSKFAPGTPCWVDLGTTDIPAATTFYGTLFGWTIEDLGPEAGGYGFIRQGDKQVGGIGPATDPARGTSWAVYLSTDDVDATAAKVEANGGKVLAPPMDVMDQGRMAVLVDPTGGIFSAWQAGAHKGSELVDAHGSLSWAELMTADVSTAKAFYEAVFPVTTRDVGVDQGMTYTLFEVDGKSVAGAMQIGPEQAGMPTAWSIYFAVDDCDAVADKAAELGATELMRDDSPAGRLAIFRDPQGGTFAIIKNNPDFSM